PDAERPTHAEDIKALAADMKAGSVSALFILGGNPVYDAPADLGFGEALAKVAETAHLSAYNDETSRACKWHANRAHYLEAWGDARAYDGVYSVVQPLIDPLFGGRSAIETIAAVLGAAPQKGYDIVRETFRRFARGSYEASWRRALHDGLVEGTAFPAERPSAAPRTGTQVPARALGPAENGALELVFVQDSKVYDGRFANSAWLQELPDFMTKLTWDNAALVSPATAEKLGVRHGDLARLTLGGRTLEAAVYLMPGQAAGSVALALGYGRKAAGKVGGFYPEGVETTGFDAGALRASDAPWIASGLKVEPTGRSYVLATTQDHHLIDAIGEKGRDERMGQLIREADLEHYEHHPDFAQHVVHHPELVSLWKEHEYEGYRWAMAIDLNLCTGCNA
ncbi:MAG: molybdopterin oxidoreductase, partial [Candidatus Methylomirabilis sp.]|nr:molybdopterin oxidoreductase [Deltaproteobacteria bacterium]